jgi:hypothetical protein
MEGMAEGGTEAVAGTAVVAATAAAVRGAVAVAAMEDMGIDGALTPCSFGAIALRWCSGIGPMLSGMGRAAKAHDEAFGEHECDAPHVRSRAVRQLDNADANPHWIQ